MSNTDTAAPAALRNPLEGLKRAQVKQLGQAIQRTTALNGEAEKARKSINEHRFTISKNYSKAETSKAVLQAARAEKAREKAEAGLAKLAESLKANKPVKQALATYFVIEKSAGAGNQAARQMLDEVSADLTIAMAARAPAKEKTATAGTSKTASVEEMLNGIGVGRTAKKIEERIGELTERARGEVADEAAGQRKRKEPNEFQEPAPYPASLLARYTLRGNEVVDKRLGEVAFVDHGKELRATKGDVAKDVIDAMLDTAASRGWAPLKVFGTQAFKAAVWMEAASRGLDVTGYKPSVQEQAAAAQNRAINGHGNRILGEQAKQLDATPLSRNQQLAAAFQEAGTAKAQAKAAKEHPELAKAFALMAAFDKALAKPGMSRNEVKDFTDQFKELVTDRLEKGKSLPNIELRDLQQEKQQTQAEDQER